MNIFLINTFIFFFVFIHAIAQTATSANEKVSIYIHKQSGKIYEYEDFYGQANHWLSGTFKYVFKISGDTTYYYLDEADIDGILATKDSIAKVKLHSSVSIGELIDLNGTKYDQPIFEDKVLVFNFWGIGCRPCIAEFPELNKLVSSFEDKDVLFFAPTSDDNNKVIDDFLSQRDFKYTVIPDARDLAEKLNAFGLPIHAIIDRNGILRFIQFGGKKETIFSVLETEINKYL